MCLGLALQGGHTGEVTMPRGSSSPSLKQGEPSRYLLGYTGPSPDLTHWENRGAWQQGWYPGTRYQPEGHQDFTRENRET